MIPDEKLPHEMTDEEIEEAQSDADDERTHIEQDRRLFDETY